MQRVEREWEDFESDDGLLPGTRLGRYEKRTRGFYTILEDHLTVPFTVDVLGAQVIVDRVDLADDERIVAVCRRGTTRQRISILDLPVSDSPPAGWE